MCLTVKHTVSKSRSQPRVSRRCILWWVCLRRSTVVSNAPWWSGLSYCRTLVLLVGQAILPLHTSKAKKRELSYRKQIACQPRIQYAEGIYRSKYYTVTLKSRLRVAQDNWKRYHWIDYTRLTISRVIWRWLAYYRDLEMWFRSHSRSLKVVPFWKLGYGFLFAFHSNYGRIFIHFGDIQRQRMA